jgi:predicted type IV restriction endonuclease
VSKTGNDTACRFWNDFYPLVNRNTAMKQKLVKTIDDIKNIGELMSLDEASTKAAIVLRVLSELGWNPFNIAEVKPEYEVGDSKVDYALRSNEKILALIEVKSVYDDLKPYQKDLLSQSFLEGTPMAMLTNGVSWWFYLPLSEGSPDQRRFLTIDLIDQDVKEVTDQFIAYLSKSAIDSGSALKNAEKIVKNRQKETVLREILPKVWNNVVEGPHDVLINLLGDLTEKISGYRPEIIDIKKFLKDTAATAEPTYKRVKHVSTASQEMSIRNQQDPDDYLDSTLDSFIFLGKTYHLNSWQDLLVNVAGDLNRRHRDNFQKYLSLGGSETMYFSTDRNLLNRPKRVPGTQFYAETKLNPNATVRRCRELMGLFGYKDGDLEIFVKR